MADQDEAPKPDLAALLRAELFKKAALESKIKLLEQELAEKQEKIDSMVPRDKAKRVVKLGYAAGQLKGKKELEDKLVFPPPPESTPLFSALRDAYLISLKEHRAEGGKKKPPTDKTLEEYRATLDLFISVMGDQHIGAIDREMAGKYFSTLKRLPANMNRLATYRGKTIAQILAMNPPPQSETTVSQKVERLSTALKWALAEKRKWGIDANPFEGYGQARDDEGKAKRRPFTYDELRALLAHPNFGSRQFQNSYAYWLIPMGLFTGARLGEICQLELKDFIEVEGVPCIDINDNEAEEGGRKKLKTRNARRLVPIHHALIEIGLMRHVVRMRELGEKRLFPELNTARRDGPGHAASNWFSRFREKAGVINKGAVFHSFRHLFITNLLDAGIPEHQAAPIVGHEAKLITGQVYWNTRSDVKARQNTVEKFKLPEDIRYMIPSVDDITFRLAQRRKARGKKGNL